MFLNALGTAAMGSPHAMHLVPGDYSFRIELCLEFNQFQHCGIRGTNADRQTDRRITFFDVASLVRKARRSCDRRHKSEEKIKAKKIVARRTKPTEGALPKSLKNGFFCFTCYDTNF